ncbi:MAG TPA: hypothetical protein VMF65_24570 [Acidimicrobiales bacterium]|nr:hypothetical protein [Acidimicrobiales bacterium]
MMPATGKPPVAARTASTAGTAGAAASGGLPVYVGTSGRLVAAHLLMGAGLEASVLVEDG